MTLSAAEAKHLRKVWQDEDPRPFMRALYLLNTRNRPQVASPLWPEQDELVDAVINNQNVLTVKPRQVGFTTILCLLFFARAYRSPDAHKVLQVAHDPKAIRKLTKVVRTAYDYLPPELQFGLKVDSREQTEFAHNRAGFDRILAGAKGQARGDTYNDAHFTEMAFYAASTSARGKADQDSDADIFSSVQAAMHDPAGRTVVESTGDGPRGKFYDMVKVAMNDPEWRFIFIPWSRVDRYTSPVPRGFEPNDEERKLQRDHGLTLGQLAWRRKKMASRGMTPIRFRREYPLTWMDPFILQGAGWYDFDALNFMAATIPPGRNDRGELRLYEPFEAGRRYFIGMDCCGGVGGDEACIKVLRDDLVVVAQWASRTTDTAGQALWLSRLGGMYGIPLTIVEANTYGAIVIEKVRALGGVRLWTHPDTQKPFTATGGRAGQTKREALVYSKELVDKAHVVENDLETMRQLQCIVEHSDGRIEKRYKDDYDDRADALYLALWAARGHWRPRSTTIEPSIAQGRVLLDAHRRFTQGGVR